MSKYACCVCYRREAVRRLTTNLDLGFFLLCGKKKCHRSLMKSLQGVAKELSQSAVPVQKSAPPISTDSRRWLWALLVGLLVCCLLIIFFSLG